MSFMKVRMGGAWSSRAPIVRAIVALAFTGLFTAACKDSTGPETLTTLTITPTTATVGPGGTVQFTAAGTRSGIDVTDIVGETWSVTGGGTISNSGLFTAPTTPGTSTVTVTCGGLSTVATVTRTVGPLATITVTPNPTLAIGAQQQFTAVGLDAFGNVVAITPVWTTTNPPGTIIAGTGLFTAGNTLGTFNASVRATSGTIFGTANVTVIAGPLATITVTPNPATLETGAQQQFTAVGRDAGGNVVPITPVWTTTNPPGTINASTGLFTAGTTTGTFDNSVRATQGTIFGTATVIVTAPAPAALATITVTPNPATLETGAQQQFTAVGRDASGNVVAITPVWSVTNGGGTINAGTGLFTAGTTTGTFTNTVRASQGSIFGTATVIVTASAPPPVPLPPPVPAAGFRTIARVAWTCTNGSIAGSVATNQTASEVPPGSVTQTLCPISGTTEIGTAAAKQAYQDFLIAYAAREAIACGTTLTGTLAGQILPPGVYCFDAAAVLTGTLTLAGPSTGQWLFKIGTSGTGYLEGTNFSVVMAGGASACNVEWWVRQYSAMTTSDFKGHILAGAGVSFTGGTYKGNAWSKEDVTVTGTAVTACDAP